MSNYILLVETGADVPNEMAERYAIVRVPMHVSFGNVTKEDGGFPIHELFEYYDKTGKLPQTSGCMPDDYEKIFDKLHKRFPDKHILHLAYSAATSCSMQSAIIAADGREYVTSMDTRHVSAGQMLVTLCMARFLEAYPDCPLDLAIKKAEILAETCRMGFIPGDLLYLKAGGRVSNASYLGAKILNLHPLIEIHKGNLKATKKYRGNLNKIAPRLLNEFSQNHHLSREIIAFVYSEGLSEELKKQMTEQAVQMGYREVLWVQTGCVVSTHSGPGAFGISGFIKNISELDIPLLSEHADA